MIYENNRILLSVLSMCWVFQFICGIIKEATWFFQNLFQLYRLYFLNIIKVTDCLCWLTSGLEWPNIRSELTGTNTNVTHQIYHFCTSLVHQSSVSARERMKFWKKIDFLISSVERSCWYSISGKRRYKSDRV